MEKHGYERIGGFMGERRRGSCWKWGIGAGAVVCAAFVLWSMMAVRSDGEAADSLKGSEKAVSCDRGTTYGELYQAFSEGWEEREREAGEAEGMEDLLEEEGSAMLGDLGEEDWGWQSEEGVLVEHGVKNLLGEGVEEGDTLKDDGRYLYRFCIADDMEKYIHWFLQIADTKDGLEIIATLQWEEDESARDFFVWKDSLILIAQEKANSVQKNAAQKEGECYRIHVYDIKDRSNPQMVRTLKVKGSYKDSWMVDGYLYLFGECKTARPQSQEDYGTYVPEVDGEFLPLDQIFLPKEAKPDSYLLMASMALDQLEGFTDAKAVAVSHGNYYMGREGIYIMDSKSMEERRKEADGGGMFSAWEEAMLGYQKYSNSTDIYRFSYEKGKIEKRAEGRVKGILNGMEAPVSINAYHGCLRLVTNVRTQIVKRGEDAGTDFGLGKSKERGKGDRDSSDGSFSGYGLYVLDEDLRVVGQVEDITKCEYFEGMEFFGDLGVMIGVKYNDPLVFVDLSNPWLPKVLEGSEIRGFQWYSTYLQFYKEGLLFGIGEETISEADGKECMKVSLLDVSDPTDVKEQSKLLLDGDAWYTEAVEDYQSVLADADRNLFGFSLEGLTKVCYQLVSIEDGALKEGRCILCEDEIYDGSSTIDYAGIRGTYIGDRFFISYYSGRIAEYRLADGKKIDEAVPDWQRLGIQEVFQ